jgi:chromosome segregation ATPase
MAGVDQRSRSPAEALLDRKLRLAEALECRTLLADLADLDEQIAALVRGRVELDLQIQAAKGALAEAETLAALNADVTGSNEAQRKLQREAAVLADPAFRAATAELRRLEAQLAHYEADLDTAKRRERRLTRTIDYRVAALRFLGGGD